jgi:hypothetical protein
LALELFLIDTLHPEYKILKVAGSSAGTTLGPPSAEHRAKLSVSVSASKMGHFVSDDTKLRMSISHGGSPVFVYNAETLELLSSHPSAATAGRHLGISGETVRKYKKSGAVYRSYLFKSSLIV